LIGELLTSGQIFGQVADDPPQFNGRKCAFEAAEIDEDS
jgi:hypothetical protein